ncbi:hypothetical protein U8P71_34515 (plasmid) [Rhizobium ruizarguesonis]|nr:hypothetical protein U8P71_34515 [Rhizobium ruizarguesonis]
MFQLPSVNSAATAGTGKTIEMSIMHIERVSIFSSGFMYSPAVQRFVSEVHVIDESITSVFLAQLGLLVAGISPRAGGVLAPVAAKTCEKPDRAPAWHEQISSPRIRTKSFIPVRFSGPRGEGIVSRPMPPPRPVMGSTSFSNP